MKEHESSACDAPDCCGVNRREFIKVVTLGTVAALLPEMPGVAGPFADADFDQLVPADKKLHPDWIKSLFARGTPTVYRGAELEKIGMPIGGICTGQLYLGGDGKLWHWDIFNQPQPSNFTSWQGPNYANPPQPSSPIEQGFAIKTVADGQTQIRTLDSRGFKDIAFRGQYPIGFVEYHDQDLPVTVQLQAFSPFIPLNPEDSGLPATVMEFTLTNTSKTAVEIEMAGWLENAVCFGSGKPGRGSRRNRLGREEALTYLECTAEPAPESARKEKRPDIVFEDFEKTNYEGWTVTGTAFGSGPIEKHQMPSYQGDVGAQGERLVNTHNARQGENVAQADEHIGTLTSKPFTIERDYINFLIGGGAHPEKIFMTTWENQPAPATQPFGAKLCGALGQRLRLRPGASEKITFVIAWHFPAVRRGPMRHITDIKNLWRSYRNRFDSAASVVRYVAKNFEALTGQTRLWHQTWYDSTLPYWFLDRTFLNLSILATATCYHFTNGRFYGWEGTYCCAGTCTHVWQYAQGLSRIFPQLERAARELTDYGIAFHADTGAMDYRAEADRRVAIDGQAGTILRAYREHQMSADNIFLQRYWTKIKKSIEYLIQQDADDDGVLEGEQYNTLDASWYGQISWLSSLYLAAVRTGAAMAREIQDDDFARRCDAIVARGSRLLVEHLFNGEYFIQRPDPSHAAAINTNDDCHIDQVYGQSWTFQVGLPRVLPVAPTCAALASLWKYNFTPDIGPYRENFQAIRGGRWYAMPGEGGLLMCTWPKGGAEKAPGKGNPWNEVECSDHYARAMASYGVLLVACGYEYHGPPPAISVLRRV